jgi:hypothetical protein
MRGMCGFYCINRNGKICGWVGAIDGDTAWLLARLVNPDVDHLVPAW